MKKMGLDCDFDRQLMVTKGIRRHKTQHVTGRPSFVHAIQIANKFHYFDFDCEHRKSFALFIILKFIPFIKV